MSNRVILVDELKFDDCISCKFLNRQTHCDNCDVGEYYESLDEPGVDDFFRSQNM